ncbi:hypothetical protein [Algoriphagus aquimarinus]|uniref:hypothetical protein n=1 Tax=Algoriphagus aquimarinus TaxID=237018 RepID=UPI0030DCCCB7|tara:strand:- start:4423 stop:4824 length:402 start_codon:yes stop_codon:yes gene_type:complete
MANLTSDQAQQLSDNFFDLSVAITDFRIANWEKLSLEENKELGDTRYKLLKSGEDILAFATTLIMDEVADSLGKINTITEDIKGTIKTLRNIQKGLDVAATLVALGIAIIAKDPQRIGKSIKSVFDTWSAPSV